ncbi:hypothetical protein LPB140_04375 [Sphingorhabdus lutea]|uniref:RcnB family protein n=1 Tax=Sphingorhabdus lutea TaxID=1913578 RepID=A0A1L3JAL9_9SPHN|nr:RcnB family protein [Sphingorhabdus lutea]APG62168.1 hypothetical protein LPB140_04375 [Sphingorhabdus lutea]
MQQKIFIAALMAATTLYPINANAQQRWKNNQGQSQSQERGQERSTERVRENNQERRSTGGFGDRQIRTARQASRQDAREARPQNIRVQQPTEQAAQRPARQAAQPPAQERARQRVPIENRRDARHGQNDQSTATPTRNSNSGYNRWQNRSAPSRDTAQYDNRRDGQNDRRYERNNDNRRDDRYRGNSDRFEYRGRSYSRWQNNWRSDRRYDWRGHRNQNRKIYYRPYHYYAPYRGHYYSRINIGFYLGSGFYASNYWINDYDQYRLPPSYGPYRWVRYYDDVLLVDTRNGYVVDTIYDFFW